MRIERIEESPFHAMPYMRVKKGGQGVEAVDLLFYKIFVDRLPGTLQALLVTSDLQGVEIKSCKGGIAKAGTRLLGHVLAEKAPGIVRSLGTEAKRTGVLLAGDLHSDPALARRGGFGDVREIWKAFRDAFRWVAGVAGNHDSFGQPEELLAFRQERGIHLLVKHVVTLDDLRLGGVSGVVGNSSRPWRNPEAEHGTMIHSVANASPWLMLLHEGPSLAEHGLEGSDAVRGHLEGCRPCLVICGHRHWPGNAIHPLHNGVKVLSCEGKVLVVMNDPRECQHDDRPNSAT